MLAKELKTTAFTDATIDKGNVVWLNIRQNPFTIYGLDNPLDGTPYHRIPRDVAKNTSENVEFLNENTAGGRVRFSTNSPYIAIRSEVCSQIYYPHMGALASAGFDIYIDTDNSHIFSGSFLPPEEHKVFFEARRFFNNVMQVNDFDTFTPMTSYTVNFPLYSGVKEFYIGIHADSQIDFGKKYKPTAPIVFYGSSITQGACSSRPGTSYTALVSRALNTDFRCLGFSGAGRAEDAICDYMPKLDMSIFVSDYDYNAPTAEHLRKTHKKLYLKIREKHPDIPYIIMTKPDFYYRYKYDSERRNVIEQTYLYALSIGDEKVDFIDGASLFNGPFASECTADLTHPTDAGFNRIATAVLNSIARYI